MPKSEIELLLGKAQKLLGKVRDGMAPGEFRPSVDHLEKEIAALTNPAASARILPGLEPLKLCEYVLRNFPDRKNELVVPEVETLVNVIRDEMYL